MIFVLFFIAYAYSWPVNDTDFRPEVYGDPKNLSGVSVSSRSPSTSAAPQESRGSEEEKTPIGFRNGLANPFFRWGNGIIPFAIEGTFDQEQLFVILQAMKDFNRLTCLYFMGRTNQTDFVAIRNDGKGCFARIGRAGGRQILNLELPYCVHSKGMVLHELMHTAGFVHEHARKDRDHYVTIMFDNINPEKWSDFEIAQADLNDFGVPYDFESVMHYPLNGDTINDQLTIVPKVPGILFGERPELSAGDIMKLNRMYNCPMTNPSKK